jgi:Second Messenger Oligonucleotide or Dinucleotide Synthetase domain
MRLKRQFDLFLRDTVNINKTRLDQLDTRVEAIYNALSNDKTLGPYVQDKMPQGSWAHETIIKPFPNKEFDADFLLLLEEHPDWSTSPKRYIEEVDKALGRNAIYKSMPRKRKCRCVRVTYANDCHIDIVPYLMLGGARKVIVNGNDDKWEDTNPEGFTEWMKEKDQVAGANLRRVIRLLKYLRDHKGTFDGVRSVILTTVVGERVEEWRTLGDPDYYGDVPTTLKNVINDLDEWLKANPTRPSIPDPSGSGTTFDHRWTDATYQNFSDKIHEYAANITAAYDCEDEQESIELWRAVFGDDFGEDPETDKSASVFLGTSVASAATATRRGRAG